MYKKIILKLSLIVLALAGVSSVNAADTDSGTSSYDTLFVSVTNFVPYLSVGAITGPSSFYKWGGSTTNLNGSTTDNGISTYSTGWDVRLGASTVSTDTYIGIGSVANNGRGKVTNINDETVYETFDFNNTYFLLGLNYYVYSRYVYAILQVGRDFGATAGFNRNIGAGVAIPFGKSGWGLELEYINSATDYLNNASWYASEKNLFRVGITLR